MVQLLMCNMLSDAGRQRKQHMSRLHGAVEHRCLDSVPWSADPAAKMPGDVMYQPVT
jgi:hypothetical protein